MDINLIHTEWAQDSILDKDMIAENALQIPLLHGKYMRYLSDIRLSFRKKNESRKLLEKKLEDYYQGKIDGKDIGRVAWQLEESKASTEKRIATDKDMIRLNIEIAEEEEKVLLLKEIINNLNQRNFQLKVALDFLKWSQGG